MLTQQLQWEQDEAQWVIYWSHREKRVNGRPGRLQKLVWQGTGNVWLQNARGYTSQDSLGEVKVNEKHSSSSVTQAKIHLVHSKTQNKKNHGHRPAT